MKFEQKGTDHQLKKAWPHLLDVEGAWDGGLENAMAGFVDHEFGKGKWCPGGTGKLSGREKSWTIKFGEIECPLHVCMDKQILSIVEE